MLRPILVHGVSIGIVLQVTKKLSVEKQSREWGLNFKFLLLKVCFKYPDEWPKWIRRFERYRLVSGLDRKSSDFKGGRGFMKPCKFYLTNHMHASVKIFVVYNRE